MRLISRLTSHLRSDITRNSAEILRCHNIYVDRNASMPPDVEQVCENVKAGRPGKPTPKSIRVARLWPETKNMSGADAMRILDNYLGARGELEAEVDPHVVPGELHIRRTYSRDLSAEAVPLATLDNDLLQNLLELLGIPSQPRPDITYGFMNDVLTDSQLLSVATLPATALATREAPCFPFWLVEWKGKRGLMADAVTQVRRDGVAAVNAMHNFYNELGCPQTASDALVFSACVDSNMVALRCHWRSESRQGHFEWEAEQIGGALLNDAEQVYRIRSIIINIFEWARSTRLPKV